MYNTIINAREELRALKRLLKKTGAAKISSGTLERSVSSKGVRFVFRNRKTGKRVVLSAGEAEEICIAKYQAALHKRLLKNCRALESFLRNYSSIRPEDIWASLPESYRPLPNSTPCTASKDTGNSYHSGLSSKDLALKSFIKKNGSPVQILPIHNSYPFKKPHFTMLGIMVRSKSECMIGNYLESLGIEYYYDCCIILVDSEGNTIYRYPDFVILCPDGTIIFWEHFGRLHDESYSNENGYKLHLYAINGIIPGYNLVITAENADGSIHASAIKNAVDSIILPHFNK